MGHLFFGRVYRRGAVGCKNGTQLAYQRRAMRTLLALSAFGGLIAGGRHFLNFLSQREKPRARAKRREIRKNQGGAQVRPRKRASTSPRGVTQDRAR